MPDPVPGEERERIVAAAELLYDNRVGWGEGRAPTAGRAFWAALGMSLGRDMGWLAETDPDPENAESERQAALSLLNDCESEAAARLPERPDSEESPMPDPVPREGETRGCVEHARPDCEACYTAALAPGVMDGPSPLTRGETAAILAVEKEQRARADAAEARAGEAANALREVRIDLEKIAEWSLHRNAKPVKARQAEMALERMAKAGF